jgi:hypothetical protein
VSSAVEPGERASVVVGYHHRHAEGDAQHGRRRPQRFSDEASDDEPVEELIARTGLSLDTAIAHPNYARGGRRDLWRVCRQNYRHPGLAVQLHEQVEHAPSVIGIKIAGGLVGDQKRRPMDERARHGRALQLSSRELPRIVGEPMAEPDAVEQPPRPRLNGCGALAGK